MDNSTGDASNPGAPGHSPGGHATPHQSFWLWVMCLTGLDYFSTLGYQPFIAFDSAGLLAPLATVVLVLLTLFGALPVYNFVAARSPHGQGSIAMLEKLVSGWGGKALVLVLLGFAATDFVITKTLSAADAVEHILANPSTKSALNLANEQAAHPWQLGITAFLLVLLGAMFLRGFREVLGLAAVIVGTYLLLTAIVVGAGLAHLVAHPDVFGQWWRGVQSGDWFLEEAPLAPGGWLTIIGVPLLLFPKLALGLSGFETGVAVMPLIKGDPGDDPARPAGRIRNARKLLLTAAVLMAVLLLGSSLVVSTLIPAKDLVTCSADGTPPTDAAGQIVPKLKRAKPPASSRALAYLAHAEGPHNLGSLFGYTFGTVYDIATVVILWFAGASAMAGLLNLVPQYLPRYGMAPDWARATRPLVILFTVINLIVTYVFDANVEKQSGAYATGVLVLITSACVATVIACFRDRTGSWWRRLPLGYGVIMLLFFYTTIANIIERPDGVKIAACFTGIIIVASLASRVRRARELRFGGFQFADETARFLWASICGLSLPILVPHRPGKRSLADKERAIRKDHRLGPDEYILFIEVDLADPSEFYQQPILAVKEEEGRYLLQITRTASISHTLAAVALELAKAGHVPEIHFGWTEDSPVAGTFGFLLFGEGNVPWMVHELLKKAAPDEATRPKVVVGGV